MDSSGSTSVGSLQFWAEKFGTQGLVASSLNLGWSGLSAALRTHDRGVIEWKSTPPETTVCVALCRSNAVVTARLGGGAVDRTIAQRGTVWLTPRGLQGGRLEFYAPVPQALRKSHR